MADGPVGRRRLSPNLIAAAILLALAIAVVGWQRPWTTEEESTSGQRAAGGPAAIAAQISDLDRARTRQAFVAAAGDTAASRAWADQTYANLTLLGASGVQLRYVRGGRPGVGDQAGVEATVEVVWTPGEKFGLGGGPTERAEVTFVFDLEPDGSYSIRDAKYGDGVLPLWLAGKLEVSSPEGATIISVDGGAPDKPIADYASRARDAVNNVVTTATSELVVVSPKTQRQAAALLGQTMSSVEQIAAVTTTLDGSTSMDSPIVIILNPAVFASMDTRAAQIVMTHEATHVMTDAAQAAMDAWVAEGFADFVALHNDQAPLSVSAGQILSTVRSKGAPNQLPTAEDFSSDQHGLGGTYESAWMAFRMLGEDFTDSEILDFYNAVRVGTPTDEAAGDVFDLTLAQITGKWQRYLEKSASIGS